MTTRNIARSASGLRYPARFIETVAYGSTASALIAYTLASAGVAISVSQALGVLAAEWLGVMTVCGWTPLTSQLTRAHRPSVAPAAAGNSSAILLQFSRITRILALPERSANGDRARHNDQNRAA